MVNKRIVRGLALVSLLAVSAPAIAAGPQIWVVSGAADFGRGDAGDGVAIGADGVVRLAPRLDPVADAPEPRIWAAVAGGGATWVAAGESGRVMRIDQDGSTEVVFEAPELGAQALAWGPDGNLYVAAGPRGGVYRVPADHDGSALEAWYDPGTTYVWDLLFDADGRLYVATGGDGAIHRVAPDGAGEVLYDSPEPHVTTLALGEDGSLLAGTEGEGLVYRISPGGEVFVLYDAPLREITDLAVAGGLTWASAFGAAAAAPEGGTETEPTRASRAPSGDGSDARGAIYAIESDGYARELWRGDTDGAYALARVDGGVLAGTGPRGRLLHVGTDGATTQLADTDAAQVVALVEAGERTLLVTSNPGRVFALHDGPGDTGAYESEVRDAGTISHWGTIRWYAEAPDGTAVRVSTRSGNTAEPDDTWSAWSEPYGSPDGSAITSPSARFVQWRAELDGGTATPALHRVEVAYVTRNLPPRIDDLTVHPAGVVYRQTASFEDGLPFAQLPPAVSRALRESDPAAPSTAGRGFLGRPFFIAGLQTFTWQASDPNDDPLRFDLEFRGEAESDWKPLAAAIEDGTYVLDTRRVADGTYLVRLSASDAASHPAADALRASRVSRTFRVDNTAPEVLDLRAVQEAGAIRVTGRARDETSLVDSLQYSVDGGDWRTVVPADGVADSADETISITLEGLSPGEHVVVVRASDTALNEGAGRVVFDRN